MSRNHFFVFGALFLGMLAAQAQAPQATPAEAAKETVTKQAPGNPRWPTADQIVTASKGRDVRVVLVGDSTMQQDSGYGSGFCALALPDTACINAGRGGRSTSSYRAEGAWQLILDALNQLTPAERKRTWVLIQFGHNDQPGKPGRSTDLATEFPANLHHYVQDLKAIGANAVLVTSLSRRSYKDGKIDNGLEPWAKATRTVAKEEKVPLLDLNRESVAYLNQIGPEAADTLAVEPAPSPKFDHTHVGPKGAATFGTMVARELTIAVPELKSHFRLP